MIPSILEDVVWIRAASNRLYLEIVFVSQIATMLIIHERSVTKISALPWIRLTKANTTEGEQLFSQEAGFSDRFDKDRLLVHTRSKKIGTCKVNREQTVRSAVTPLGS